MHGRAPSTSVLRPLWLYLSVYVYCYIRLSIYLSIGIYIYLSVYIYRCIDIYSMWFTCAGAVSVGDVGTLCRVPFPLDPGGDSRSTLPNKHKETPYTCEQSQSKIEFRVNSSSSIKDPHKDTHGQGEATSQHCHRGQQTLRHKVTGLGG